MASRIDRLRLLDRFRKKLTVMGIMGHTQGVSRANSPPTNPEKKRNHNDVSVVVVVSPRACSLSMTGVHKSVVVVCAVGVVAVVTSFEAGLAVSAVFSAGWATFCFGSLFFFFSRFCRFFLYLFFGAAFAAVAAKSAAERPFPVNSNSSLVGGRQDWSSQVI